MFAVEFAHRPYSDYKFVFSFWKYGSDCTGYFFSLEDSRNLEMEKSMESI